MLPYKGAEVSQQWLGKISSCFSSPSEREESLTKIKNYKQFLKNAKINNNLRYNPFVGKPVSVTQKCVIINHPQQKHKELIGQCPVDPPRLLNRG